jgi:hypothetical protein
MIGLCQRCGGLGGGNTLQAAEPLFYFIRRDVTIRSIVKSSKSVFSKLSGTVAPPYVTFLAVLPKLLYLEVFSTRATRLQKLTCTGVHRYPNKRAFRFLLKLTTRI